MRKKFFKKLIILFLFIIFIYTINSCASDSDFTYTLDSNNFATITSYKGTSSSITIPSIIDGYQVKKIGEHAFDENRNTTNGKILKTITISEGITTIGDFAFIDCINLESIKLPETLTSLGFQSFIRCSKLTNINLPSNITSIGPYEFQEAGFTEFIVPENIKNIYGCAFRSCHSLKSFKVYSKDVVYDTDIFEYCPDDLVLYGYKNSTTQTYAEQNGLKFQVLSNENESNTDNDNNNDNNDNNNNNDNDNDNSNNNNNNSNNNQNENNNDNISIQSITLNKTSLSLNIGNTETLTATILPYNASDKNLIWLSNNLNIAIVENGKVTAKNPGSTTISVSTKDGTQTATCKITVIQESTKDNSQQTDDNKNNNQNPSTDNTTSKNTLPKTGINHFTLILLFTFLIISSILYKHYKKIKNV